MKLTSSKVFYDEGTESLKVIFNLMLIWINQCWREKRLRSLKPWKQIYFIKQPKKETRKLSKLWSKYFFMKPLFCCKRKNEILIIMQELGPSSITATDEKGQTPLHVAANEGLLHVVQFLVIDVPEQLKIPVDVNKPDESGRTALISAAFQSSTKTVKLDHLKICEFLLQQVLWWETLEYLFTMFL